MTLKETIEKYLAETGESKRALSLRAGQHEAMVRDICRLPGLTPQAGTVKALSDATGLDLAACLAEQPITYAELILRLKAKGEMRAARRITWLMKVTGWVPSTEKVCRRAVVEFLERHNGAAFNLSPGSYATYKSECLAVVTPVAARQRPRGVADLVGRYEEIDRALKDSDLPDWRLLPVGTFLLYLQDHAITPENVTTETLSAYYADRLARSPKSEQKCRDHVREIAILLTITAGHPDLSGFGFNAVDHPFEEPTGKYGIGNDVIAPLMAEFDSTVAPWALGELSRDGQSRKAFIEALDHKTKPVSEKKAKLLAAKKRNATTNSSKPSDASCHDEQLAAGGFLTTKQRWSEKTLETRRGYVVSLAKAIIATSDVVPETMEELLDPDYLEVAVKTIRNANEGEYPTGYLRGILSAVSKIASSFQRRPADDLDRIADFKKTYRGPQKKGIAPRNRAKLQKFDEPRIQGVIDLGDTIINDVNAELSRRRRAFRKKHGRKPETSDIIDARLARDVMAALAHEILLRRAPRSDNLIRARLDWIAWQGDRARIVIPASEIKMRGADDEPLTIWLNERLSGLLRKYLDHFRPQALVEGDAENPYLFPAQIRRETNGEPFFSLLKRVTKLLHHQVGVPINPHLYRHLLGWIWLKDSLDHLPKVSRLLGHKSLQTTLDYYAELDESLVFDEWNDHLEGRRSAGRKNQRRHNR